MGIRIQLFGGPRVQSEDKVPVKLPTKRSGGLLAYLADHRGEMIPRERISELFWPRREPEQSRASLRQELAVLRKAIAPFDADSIYADRDVVTYTNSQTFIDTQEFRALVDPDQDIDIEQKMLALALYGQPFLRDLRIRSAPFEEWVWSSNQYFQESALSLGLQALEHWLGVGDGDKVIQVARRLIDIEPSQEIAHRTLIKAYWKNGHTGLALRQYKACQEALDGLLNVKPSQETIDLAARILKDGGSETSPSKPSSGETDLSEISYTSIEERRIVSILSFGQAASASDYPDPEEFDDVTEAFHDIVSSTVSNYGGQVVRKDEERILACFGYPVSSEHDSDRAVMAAQSAINALRDHPLGAIACSCGLARDKAVVKSHSALPRKTGFDQSAAIVLTVTGAVNQLAQRIEHLGQRGQILVDKPTANLVSPAVALTPLQGQDDVYLAEAKNSATSRIEKRLFEFPGTVFVGRDPELDRLKNLMDDVRLGKGQILVLEGEPGIGKSRLAHELATHALSENIEVLQFNGTPHETNTALFPVAEYARHNVLTNISPKNTNAYVQLCNWLASLGADMEKTAPYFATLLTIDPGPFAAAAKVSKELGEAALDYFAASAAITSPDAPVLMIFEDVHWFDPTTIDALSRLLDVVHDHAAFVILTSRKGERPEKFTRPELPVMVIERLLTGAATNLVKTLLLDICLSADLIENIVERAEGSPLVLEEFSKAIKESVPDSTQVSLNARDPNLALGITGQNSAKIAIPDTLAATLLSRIDNIPEARPILQRAAVLGRRFSLSNLVAMARMSVHDVLQSLSELEKAELVFRRSWNGELEFLFKHALVQEISYSTILKRHRPNMHQAAAEAILTDPSNDPRAGVVAKHYELAGATQKAAEFYQQAGHQSVRISAHQEAISHFKKALALTGQAAPSKRRYATELSLTRKIGAQLISVNGIPTADVEDVYLLTCELSDKLGDLEEIANARWGIWGVYLVAGNLAQADTIADELLVIAGKTETAADIMIAKYVKGVTHAYSGNLAPAIDYLSEALGLYDTTKPEDLEIRFGMNIAMTANSFLCWVYALGDREAEADLASTNALDLAEQIQNGFSQTFANVFSATKSLFLDQTENSKKYSEAAYRLASREKFPPWKAQAQIQAARIADLNGDPQGLADLRGGLEAYLASGSVLARPYAQVWIAEALLRRGHFAEASAEIDDLLDYTRRSGECYFDGDALWVKYQAHMSLLKRGGDDDVVGAAEAILLEARKIAECQGARRLIRKIGQSVICAG